MSDERPRDDFRVSIDRMLRAIPSRPVLIAMTALTAFLLRYGMFTAAAAGAMGFATLLLGARAIADFISGSASESQRRLRARNVAIGLALSGMVILFYVATIIRLGANALNRPM